MTFSLTTHPYFCFLTRKKIKSVCFLYELYGYTEQLTDICGPLKLGRRGMVCVGAVEQYSTLSLMYWFHSTSTTIFNFYCVAVEFLLPWTSVAIFVILVHSSIKYYVCFIIFAAYVILAHSFIFCNSRNFFFCCTWLLQMHIIIIFFYPNHKKWFIFYLSCYTVPASILNYKHRIHF